MGCCVIVSIFFFCFFFFSSRRRHTRWTGDWSSGVCSTDIIARIVGAQLTKSLGQTFLVENHPGATGNIALEMVAKAPADGYTLLVGNVSTNSINENTFAHTLTIKPSRDLVGVTKLVEIPHIVAVSAAFPVNSIAELIAAAKKNPGKINYGSAGIGSYPHLDMEKFER